MKSFNTCVSVLSDHAESSKIKSNILLKHHFITRALRDKCKVKEFDISSIVMSSNAIL